MILIAALVCSLLSIILTIITAIFSVLAYSKVVGMEKSTHQIQWMPIDQPDNSGDNDKKEKVRVDQMMKDFKENLYPDIEDEMV